jgi:D-alanyl-D-alanine carboxypeptidase (penicillin-binding protein 5/6)
VRRAALLAALAALAAAPAAAHAQVPDPPELDAASAILVEASTGEVVTSVRADERRPIASTTKLMTALVVLDRVDLDDVFTATAYDAAPIESQIGLREGERMRVADLMRGLLLESANDAAATLAVGTSGSRAAFVEEMNRRADELGLQDTSFANPIGLDDPDNLSTAADLARLTIALRESSFFRETVALPRATLRTGDRRRTVVNRNTLVARSEIVDGVKTGRTQGAGFVLVGSAQRDGVAVISAVLGEPSERARDDDTLALLRFGLDRYERATAIERGEVLAEPALAFRGDESVALVAGRTVRQTVRRGEETQLTVTGVPGELDGPLPRGSRVGTAVVRHRDEIVARVPLLTAAPVAEASLVTRLEDQMLRPQTLAALALLAACSLPLLMLRRRALRRRQREGTVA